MGSLGDPSPPLAKRPKILFIDAYDSFSNNITSQLTTLLGVDVFVLPIDSPISNEDFCRELRHYEAVVCGPGPGSPENEADVGLMRWLWTLDHDDLVPVLGVCLGFQSLVLACGGEIRRLRRGLHGMVRSIQHRSENKAASRNGGDLFNGVGDFKATLYHSLCAHIGQDYCIDDWDEEKWHCPARNPDIVPLAWVEEDRHDAEGTERILVALKHRTKPFWGLQYHPESVCTEDEGNKVVRNWMTQALRWNFENKRIVRTDDCDLLARNATRTSLLQEVESTNSHVFGKAARDWLSDSLRCEGFASQTLRLPDHMSVPNIAEALNPAGTSHIILDSANGDQPPPETGVDVRGMFSIIAVEVDQCMQIQYHTGDDFVTIVNGSGRDAPQKISLSRGQTVWHFLAEVHELSQRAVELPTWGSIPNEDDVPFLGGFVGYITYEQGLSDINVPLLRDRGHKRPDVCLAWVSKSAVVDHHKRLLHIQNIEGDPLWIERTLKELETSELWYPRDRAGSKGLPSDLPPSRVDSIVKPLQQKYEAQVRTCQEYIAAGESYELCLTDQTRITRTTNPQKDSWQAAHPEPCLPEPWSRSKTIGTDSSWHLYRTLRRRNPAPFASYLRLGGATLVSSSPERFLQYNRSGLCSMKPMKGTVKKSSVPDDGYPTTLAEAEAILHIPKEEAENLMIVDLVRHDLHGICGAGRVTVPELLKVEEYQTVYTMITTVQGQLPGFHNKLPWPKERERRSIFTGLDVLSASLPPGSMTGAPKKRSCEILQHIEDGKERSLYSGVVGYMCITGRGDWSVTIRSTFRWDDETEVDGAVDEEKEVWHIGAGGAVTILSTPEGESEEMFVKLARPLSIFTEES